FPIPYIRKIGKDWIKQIAKPMFHETDPLSIMSVDAASNMDDLSPIIIKKESSPRQGINTCGANDIYFFKTLSVINEILVMVTDSKDQRFVLPKRFVYPLITNKDFKI